MTTVTVVHTTGPRESRVCKRCGHGNSISYNWTIADKEQDSTIGAYRKVLERARPMRHGALYTCSDCGGHWHVDGTTARAIPMRLLDLLARWDETELRLSAQQTEILQAIGARPVDIYGNGAGTIDVPCEVDLANGETIPAAVISLQSHPPHALLRSSVGLISDITDVRPSQYALPAEVRIAAAQSREISYGFSPTLLESEGGALLTINGCPHFLFSHEVAASGTRPSDKKLDRGDLPAVPREFEQEIVYFIGDRFDGDENLRLDIPT